MEANKILKADLLDIIFEGRNKAYGAYDLRNTYAIRIRKAMIGMGAVCLVFITGVLMASSAKKSNEIIMFVKDFDLINVVDKPKEQPVIEPPKPKPLTVKTIAVTIPVIVPDKELDKTEVPTDAEIENVQISNKTNDNGVYVDVVPPLLDVSTGSNTQIKQKEVDFNEIFPTVQIEAQFPGGVKEWNKFLERTLNTDIPIENGAPAGRYTVHVSFLVDKEGYVSDIQALNDPGYGIADEAVKVIKKSKQWVPAIQNGNKVIYRQTQSITFVVNEG
jgi:protein TonB